MWDAPLVGQTLLLDFVDPLLKISNKEEINKKVEQILEERDNKIVSRSENSFSDNHHSTIYTLQKGILNINTHLKENMLTVEARIFHIQELSKEESNKEIMDYEASFCDAFGWDRCSGTINLPRGGNHYHIQNKYYHSETIYRNFKLIHREQTKFQDLRIFDTKEMGRVLSLDNMIQNSDVIEDDSYTIDLCSLVLNKEERYNHLLIIGAGDMIIPDYILSNFNVGKLTLVEIDDRVIENTKKYFKFYERIEEFIKQGKLEVIVDDGAKYLKESAVKEVLYDGIIIDNSDVYLFEGPAANLFTKEFYSNIHKSLRMGAFFSQQVSEEQVKARWTEMVKSVGFKVLNFKYSITPEYSTALPLGSAMRD